MAERLHILIVDDSRLVRASIGQQLKGHYEVREEADGEAAWQALVLDQRIRAVISDLQMPRMNGFQLLERLRTSRLRRLQQMPFILVSGAESEDERDRALSLGVSDFITKGIGSAEVLARLNSLLALSNAQESIEATREHLVQDPVSGLFTRKYLELQAAQALSHSARHGVETSVMVLGFDGYTELVQRLGGPVAEDVATRFARMLAGKIRQEDSLGHFGEGQYAIVSPGTSLNFCVSFADRVREAVKAARITAQGQSIAVTVSVGLAGVPNDSIRSAGNMLDLAGQRMQEAMRAGGNRLVSGGEAAVLQPISVRHALDLLGAGRQEAVVPHVPVLGKQLLPLLRLIDQELGLAMPLAELERRLNEREIKK